MPKSYIPNGTSNQLLRMPADRRYRCCSAAYAICPRHRMEGVVGVDIDASSQQEQTRWCVQDSVIQQQKCLDGMGRRDASSPTSDDTSPAAPRTLRTHQFRFPFGADIVPHSAITHV